MDVINENVSNDWLDKDILYVIQSDFYQTAKCQGNKFVIRKWIKKKLP